VSTKNNILIGLCLLLSSEVLIAAVDTTSEAYKNGNLAGKIVLAMVAVVVIRKFLFKKRYVLNRPSINRSGRSNGFRELRIG